MASSQCVLSLVLIALFCKLSPAAFVKLECKRENLGTHSQDSVMECLVKAEAGLDVTVAGVFWTKSGSNVLTYYRDKTQSPETRFQFAEPKWNTKNMNVSLLVKDTQMADGGAYKCMVITDSGEATEMMTLQVSARYSKPAMSSIPEKDIRESGKVTLFCNSSGGYPAGKIEWFDEHGSNWSRSAEMAMQETQDKRFNLTSSLTVLQASTTSSRYTCRVLNSRGEQAGETQYELKFTKAAETLQGENSMVGITAAFVVVGSLLCGFMVVLLLWRRRSTNVQYVDRRDSNLYDNVPA